MKSHFATDTAFPSTIAHPFDGPLPDWWGKPLPLLEPRCSIVGHAFVSRSAILGWPRNVATCVQDPHGQTIEEAVFRRVAPVSVAPADLEVQRTSARTISGAYVYLGWLIGHYGHFLTESISRLWYSLREASPRQFIVHANYRRYKDFPNHVQAVLKSFGITEENLLLANQPMIVEELHCPSQALRCDHGTSAHAATVYRHIQIKILGGSEPKTQNRKLYLSRSEVTGNQRHFNDSEAWAVHRNFGYERVLPETLNFQEQLALYAQASNISGPVGSAMHNAAFTLPNGVITILAPNSFLFKNDNLLAASCGYDLRYCMTDTGSATLVQRPWKCNIIQLENILGGD